MKSQRNFNRDQFDQLVLGRPKDRDVFSSDSSGDSSKQCLNLQKESKKLTLLPTTAAVHFCQGSGYGTPSTDGRLHIGSTVKQPPKSDRRLSSGENGSSDESVQLFQINEMTVERKSNRSIPKARRFTHSSQVKDMEPCIKITSMRSNQERGEKCASPICPPAPPPSREGFYVDKKIPKEPVIEVISPSQFPNLIIDDNGSESINHCSCKFQPIPTETSTPKNPNSVGTCSANSPLRRVSTAPSAVKILSTTPRPQYITIATPIQASSEGWSTIECLRSAGDIIDTPSNMSSTDADACTTDTCTQTTDNSSEQYTYTFTLVESSTLTDVNNESIEKYRRETINHHDEMDFHAMLGPVDIPLNSTFIDNRKAPCINDYIHTFDLSDINREPKQKKFKESEELTPMKIKSTLQTKPQMKPGKPDTQYLTSTPVIEKLPPDMKGHLTSIDLSEVQMPSFGSNELCFNASSREVITSEWIFPSVLEEPPDPNFVAVHPDSPELIDNHLVEIEPCCIGKIPQTLFLPADIICYTTKIPKHVPTDNLHNMVIMK